MLSACDLPAVLPTGESLARPRSATLIVELFERPLNEIKQTCFVITARTSAENDGRKRRCTVTDSERAREEMIRKPASTRLAQKLLLLVLSSSLARLRKYGFRQVWIAPATLANLRLRTALPLHRTFPSPPLSLLVTAWRKISSQAEFPAARPDHAVATRLARFIAPVLTSRTELAKEGLRNASAGQESTRDSYTVSFPVCCLSSRLSSLAAVASALFPPSNLRRYLSQMRTSFFFVSSFPHSLESPNRHSCDPTCGGGSSRRLSPRLTFDVHEELITERVPECTGLGSTSLFNFDGVRGLGAVKRAVSKT